MRVTGKAAGTGRCRRGWRLRGGVAALVLGVVGGGLTVAGTAAPASAGSLPVVSSGGGGSCALMADQTVWCWGSNATGQLGNGTIASSMVPGKVSTLGPAIGVSAGQSDNALSSFNHACAVETSSQVWCWGSNTFGELGNGTTSQDSTVPVQVQGGLLALQVSAGDGFTCAVTLTHTVKCWGDNNFGELGNGTTTDSSTPVKVKNLTNVTRVAAGYFHACALESNGTIWCWGDNTFGALGNGTTTDSSVPVQVGIQNATYVAAGADDTCAIGDAPGDLLCWGTNNDGQLGTGNFTDQTLPAQVASLSSGVQQVSMGLDFTCALANIPGTSVLCWGDNGGGGTLGNGSFNQPPSDPFPSQVFGLMTPPAGGPGGPVQVAVGSRHACVVMTSGLVQCWGEGGDGRLGTGDTLSRDIPTPVIGLPMPPGSANAVSAGVFTSCAVTRNLGADCWGQMVGDGSPLSATHTMATPVLNLPAKGVSQVSAGAGGCALVRPGGLSTELKCWGQNGFGQLGNNTTTDALKPVTVQGLGKAVQSVSNGATHTCALVHNGGAFCWGLNDVGQLGDGTTTDRHTPVPVTGLPLKLAQIAAADDHTCALLSNGTVKCWGLNNHGQLGDGSTSDSKTPVAVTGLSGVVQIAVGEWLSCALTNAGDVQCWGFNGDGQLGNGSTTDSHVPTQVSSLTSGVVSIAAGAAYACAVLISGLVDCWGDDTSGQLGNGSIGGIQPSPVTVSGFTGASLGMNTGLTSCGLNTSQQAFCWGDNQFGQLGDGTSGSATDSGTPVAVQGL